MKKLLLVLFITTFTFTQAQEKVKGNREPTTVITNVEPFNIIEIGSDYEVSIVEGLNSQIEVTTDSNLHQYLEVTVIKGKLSITSTANIRSKKEMSIRLVYPKGLNKIIARDNSEISALTDLKVEKIEIEVQDNAKLFLTAKIDELKLVLKNDAEAELNLTGNKGEISISDKASIKALLKYNDLDLDMKSRAVARLEGDIKKGTIVIESKSDYEGANLVFDNLNFTASNNTTAQVNVKGELTLSASDDATIELYNNSKITLDKFAGKTQLIKK